MTNINQVSIPTPECQFDYKSTFDNWDERSSVRTKPHRFISEEELDDKSFFSPALHPIVEHPIILALGPKVTRDLLVQRCYIYMNFTFELEHEAVIPVLNQIAHRKSGYDLPRQMVQDGNKIFTDESYHGQFSHNMVNQIESITGIEPIWAGPPYFLKKLRETQMSVPESLQDMAQQFFVIVAETLISAILMDIPRDEQVVTAVRDVVADHRDDEAYHHRYFADFLECVWPQLRPKEQSLMGQLMPSFILAFLEPDYVSIQTTLAQYHLTSEEVDEVIWDTYPKQQVLSNARHSAKALIRLCDRYGVMNDPHALEAFHTSGLVEP